MPFEYAASYPREAEQSLQSARSRLKNCFSLFDKPSRDLIDSEASIEAEREGEGYVWEIKLSPRLLEHMRQRAQEKLADLQPQEVEKFKAFDALSDDTPGQVVEFNHSYDEDRQSLYEMWSQSEGKAVAIIAATEVRKYDTWHRFKEWYLPTHTAQP